MSRFASLAAVAPQAAVAASDERLAVATFAGGCSRYRHPRRSDCGVAGPNFRLLRRENWLFEATALLAQPTSAIARRFRLAAITSISSER